jgi:hypothetical protein
MNAWSDIKSKQEIGHAAKSKASHISSQQLSDYLTDEEDFVLLDIRTDVQRFIHDNISSSTLLVFLDHAIVWLTRSCKHEDLILFFYKFLI